MKGFARLPTFGGSYLYVRPAVVDVIGPPPYNKANPWVLIDGKHYDIYCTHDELLTLLRNAMP